MTTFIENFKLSSIDLYEEKADVPPEQLDGIKTVIRESLCENIQGRFIYRGVSKCHLLQHYTGSMNDWKLCSRIFYFGEKARHFTHSIEDRKKWKGLKILNQSDRATTDQIFIKIGKITTSKNPVLLSFAEKTPDLFQYFNDPINKKDFHESLVICGVLARDYYLALLHTAGKYVTQDQSSSISTSISFDIARKFAIAHTADNRGFTIIAVNRENPLEVIRKQIIEELEQRGIPRINDPIFPAQLERTIKGGVFPHNILCVVCQHTDDIILNPHLFTPENIGVNILDQPLTIDQSDFDQKLKKLTYYHSYAETYDFLEVTEGFIQ